MMSLQHSRRIGEIYPLMHLLMKLQHLSLDWAILLTFKLGRDNEIRAESLVSTVTSHHVWQHWSLD